MLPAHWGSAAEALKFHFMFKLDTLPASVSNGQLLLDDPEQMGGLVGGFASCS